MNAEERSDLIRDYAYECVDDMSINLMRNMIAHSIIEGLTIESDEYIIKKIMENQPHLLDSDS